MVSAFASQLQAIAQKSTNELDLKARRNAHAESLLFDKAVAAKQDFDSIYAICFDGFRELCQLDSRFHDFDQNLFSEQAKVQDRDLMTKADNESLNSVLNNCLILLGSRILLKPAVKALEWLVRRFRVQVHNVDHLLCTLLPYHETQVWANVLSIIPNEKIVNQWKFIRPYLKTTWNIPRHAIAHAAVNNDGFFGVLNSYVLETCRQGPSHTALMKFWTSIVVEAVSNRLTQTRSGRKEVQSQRTEDFLHMVLPLISDGFEIRGSLDLITTCYTITIVLAARAELDDRIIDSLMLAVAQTLNHADNDSQAVLITLAVLTTHKQANLIPRKVVSILAELEVLPVIVRRLSDEFAFSKFLSALVASAISQIKSKTAHKLAPFIETLVYLLHDISSLDNLAVALQPVIARIAQLDPSAPSDEELTSHLVVKLQHLNENEKIASALSQAVEKNGQNQSRIEDILGMTISVPEPNISKSAEDVTMDEAPQQPEASDELDVVPPEWQELSFMASKFSKIFTKLSERFERAFSDLEELDKFTKLPLWSAAADKSMLWQTFLLRFACGNRSAQARVKALHLLAEAIKLHSACNLQYFVPYLLVLLMDVKVLRKSASEVLNLLHETYAKDIKAIDAETSVQFYSAEVNKTFSTISNQQATQILSDIVLPIVEECRLDQSYIVNTVHHALDQASSESKKSHKQALFNLLSQHAIATTLVKVQFGIVAMLRNTEKVGSKSVAKTLMPILQTWASLTNGEAEELANEAGLPVSAIDDALVPLADTMGSEFMRELNTSSATSRPYRAGLMTAFLRHIQLSWTTKTTDRQLATTDLLFDMSFGKDEVLAGSAQEVLRSIDLNSECIASMLHQAQVGSNETKGPTAKRKRRSSQGGQLNDADNSKIANTVVSRLNLTLELLESNVPETKPELAGSVFDLLACLKQLQQNRISSPYMMNVCLNCAYSIIQAAKSVSRTIDAASVKPELVTDILRNADNPQVQNSALQVLASLSTIVPDRMIHNVMPIFTFIGHNMLSNEDDYSVSVVNEAIDKIVPALLDNLRRSKNAQKYQSSVISMLASFTSSFDHIPVHRRVAFYQKLLQSINIDKFGFIMLALLANQQIVKPSFTKFVQDALSPFAPQTHLRVYQQLLEIALDAQSAVPKIAAAIFDIQKSTTPEQLQHYAISSLQTAAAIIKAPDLSKKMHRATKDANDVAGQLQQALQVTLASLQMNKSADQQFTTVVKQNVDVLLQLPALTDILGILQNLLDAMDVELRPHALRILALQFKSARGSTESVREKALEILQKLNGYLKDTVDEALFQASLICVDRIADLCGRKYPEAILATAEVLLREVGLSTNDGSAKRLNPTILTVASLLETLKETSVPLIPDIMRQTLQVTEVLSFDDTGYATFRALCALLLAVFSHTAFMISEEDLLLLFQAMAAAAEKFNTTRDLSDYKSLVETVAHKVDLEVILNVVLASSQTSPGQQCATEALKLTNEAISRSSKSEVIKRAESISQLFVANMDVQSQLLVSSSNADDVDEQISQQLNTTMISFIYKINDTTLRPIFESWVDWATSGVSSEELFARQVALYGLLAHFFETLKGIVTSYAGHLLQFLSRVMQNALADYKSQSSIEKILLEKTLALIKGIASYDQDTFFGAPSHFEPIAPHLVNLLRLASVKSARRLVSNTVISTLVSLASATMDNPHTHATLSHHIVQLKSAESAQVRLASIKTLLALTEDEELGDEFISNTVGIGVGEGEGARGGGSSVGEIMVYVNEMLEDDDEEVEHAVRSWVQLVRSRVGEDIFEV